VDCLYSLWSVMCLVACVMLLYLAVFLPVRAVMLSEYQIDYQRVTVCLDSY
jgi:hypothetical protein